MQAQALRKDRGKGKKLDGWPFSVVGGYDAINWGDYPMTEICEWDKNGYQQLLTGSPGCFGCLCS